MSSLHPHAKVFIVDDDAGVRDALAWLLRTRRLLSESYRSADEFWDEVQGWRQEPDLPCCVLLDVRMPGTSGLALFEQLLALPWQAAMPVIFLSGHADVPTAVDAVKRGASTFVKNPSQTTPWLIASNKRWPIRPRSWRCANSASGCRPNSTNSPSASETS